MADAWSLVGGILGGGVGGWFLHVAKEHYGRKELRRALYRELANNYSALLYNSAQERLDFDWLRDNLKHEFSFHAFRKAAANPEAFYRIPEQGWFERCFCEVAKCTLSLEGNALIEQLQRTAAMIEAIAPPADTKLFRSMLPTHYAARIN